jgi:hypothetical protein
VILIIPPLGSGNADPNVFKIARESGLLQGGAQPARKPFELYLWGHAARLNHSLLTYSALENQREQATLQRRAKCYDPISFGLVKCVFERKITAFNFFPNFILGHCFELRI